MCSVAVLSSSEGQSKCCQIVWERGKLLKVRECCIEKHLLLGSFVRHETKSFLVVANVCIE